MLAKLIRAAAKESGKAAVEIVKAPVTATQAAIKQIEKD